MKGVDAVNCGDRIDIPWVVDNDVLPMSSWVRRDNDLNRGHGDSSPVISRNVVMDRPHCWVFI